MQRYTGDYFFLQLSLISLPFAFFGFLFFYFALLLFFNFRHLSVVVLRVTNLYAPIT